MEAVVLIVALVVVGLLVVQLKRALIGRWVGVKGPTRCAECGYELAGILAEPARDEELTGTKVCPECGVGLSRATVLVADDGQRVYPSRKRSLAVVSICVVALVIALYSVAEAIVPMRYSRMVNVVSATQLGLGLGVDAITQIEVVSWRAARFERDVYRRGRYREMSVVHMLTCRVTLRDGEVAKLRMPISTSEQVQSPSGLHATMRGPGGQVWEARDMPMPEAVRPWLAAWMKRDEEDAQVRTAAIQISAEVRQSVRGLLPETYVWIGPAWWALVLIAGLGIELMRRGVRRVLRRDRMSQEKAT